MKHYAILCLLFTSAVTCGQTVHRAPQRAAAGKAAPPSEWVQLLRTVQQGVAKDMTIKFDDGTLAGGKPPAPRPQVASAPPTNPDEKSILAFGATRVQPQNNSGAGTHVDAEIIWKAEDFIASKVNGMRVEGLFADGTGLYIWEYELEFRGCSGKLSTRFGPGNKPRNPEIFVFKNADLLMSSAKIDTDDRLTRPLYDLQVHVNGWSTSRYVGIKFDDRTLATRVQTAFTDLAKACGAKEEAY